MDTLIHTPTTSPNCLQLRPPISPLQTNPQPLQPPISTPVHFSRPQQQPAFQPPANAHRQQQPATTTSLAQRQPIRRRPSTPPLPPRNRTLQTTIARQVYRTPIPQFTNTVYGRQILAHKIQLQRIQTVTTSNRHYGFCPQFLTPNNLPSFGPRINCCYLCSEPVHTVGIKKHLELAHFGNKMSVDTINGGHMILWRLLIELGICPDAQFAVTCFQLAQRASEQIGSMLQSKTDKDPENFLMLGLEQLHLDNTNFFMDLWEENCGPNASQSQNQPDLQEQ